MGLTQGELLARLRYVLFVEGPVDVIVIETLYGDLLGEVGVMLLPIYGVDEAASLAELKLIGQLVDVGAGLLFDHVRTERPSTRDRQTKEEAALSELRRQLKQRGRMLEVTSGDVVYDHHHINLLDSF